VQQVGRGVHADHPSRGEPIGQLVTDADRGADVATGRMGDLLAFTRSLQIADSGVGEHDPPVGPPPEHSAPHQDDRSGGHLFLGAPPVPRPGAAHRDHPGNR
jgi:hypothetical protein